MGQRLSEKNEPGLIYDLSAVLIHKGVAVNSGHYVAHIKDQDTGVWWEFDDETVSDLGQHPFGDKPQQTVQSPPEPDAIVNGNHMDTSATTSDAQTFSSNDAY